MLVRYHAIGPNKQQQQQDYGYDTGGNVNRTLPNYNTDIQQSMANHCMGNCGHHHQGE